MACDLGFRPSDNPEYYFLSYNTEDAERVGEIAGRMSRAGIELWYDKGIEYGEIWERTIAEKIGDCRAVVLFFTKGILSKENSYVEKEFKMAHKFHRKIYVVMMDEIDDEDVPAGRMSWWTDIQDMQCIEARQFADLEGVTEEIVSALTVKTGQGTGGPWNDSANTKQRSAYGANWAVSSRTPSGPKRGRTKCLTPYVPVGPEAGLIGRDDIVDRVRAMLESGKGAAVVSGLGGIGKTAVMAEICNSIMTEGGKDTYVAWITCGGSHVDDLLALRQPLGVPKGLRREEAYEAVVGKLQDLRGTLYLFLDDMARVPDRAELGTYNALRPNVRIMITSRHEIKGFPHVDLRELGKIPAVNMFYGYYGKDPGRKYAADAWEIISSKHVRCHTLLVELLAKAANAFYGSLADFRRRLEGEGFLKVSSRRFDTGRFDSKTIEESVMQLYDTSHLSAEQQRIMRLFSIFTPEKVIYGAVEEWAAFDADAVDGLVKLGWLARAENGFVIHQIIRDSLAGQTGGSLRIEDYGDLLGRAIDTNDYMPRDLEYTEVRERLVLAEDVARNLWPRAEGILESGQYQEDEKGLLTNAGDLFHNVACVFREQGDYGKALEYYGKSLAISERVLGPEHPDTAATYNNMAGVYEDRGDYGKALEYYGKALAIIERVLGPEHPDTATIYNNMAGVYEDRGDYGKALEYYGKALEIKLRVLGPDHSSTAATYNNMAVVFREQGEYVKALEYYGKALAIYERVAGTDHPSTATTYNNMAGVFRAQGDYGKALEYYGKALAIRERVLGTGHPYTAATYNNMAGVFRAQGDYGKALEYYEKALAVRKMKLGENHPYTQGSQQSVQTMELLIKRGIDEEQLLEFQNESSKN